MTKEEAIKVRDEYINSTSPYIVGAWITNEQGTDFWFVDVHYFFCHRNGDKDDFDKVGY